MADDDGGDWFAAADEPEPAPVIKSKSKGDAPKAEAAAAESAPAAGDAPADENRPEAEAEYIDPDKLILCKHWIRPRFLQYHYLYDYRYNYYNDVIDYLEKRQKGMYREIPRAQTWAERALRTYNSNRSKYIYNFRQQEDTKLCTNIRLGLRFHIYHSKEYFNRRYSALM